MKGHLISLSKKVRATHPHVRPHQRQKADDRTYGFVCERVGNLLQNALVRPHFNIQGTRAHSPRGGPRGGRGRRRWRRRRGGISPLVNKLMPVHINVSLCSRCHPHMRLRGGKLASSPVITKLEAPWPTNCARACGRPGAKSPGAKGDARLNILLGKRKESSISETETSRGSMRGQEERERDLWFLAPPICVMPMGNGRGYLVASARRRPHSPPSPPPTGGDDGHCRVRERVALSLNGGNAPLSPLLSSHSLNFGWRKRGGRYMCALFLNSTCNANELPRRETERGELAYVCIYTSSRPT